uniref:Uncharacterized protein n=1 Tax=Oryza rufipogon TaxID=4529 RepID=A0A0E0PL18_ORYRU
MGGWTSSAAYAPLSSTTRLSDAISPSERRENKASTATARGSRRRRTATRGSPAAHAGDHSVKVEEDVAATTKQEASGESVAASKESSDLRSSGSLCRRRKLGADDDGDGEEASAPQPCA